jgi:OTU domain-containing protein 6
MESLEELQTRHRREQKDLQARVTQKKKGATKKTRKGVNSECDELERQLKERQEQERAALDGEPTDFDDTAIINEPPSDDPATAQTNGVDQITESLEETSVSVTPSEDGQPRKRNRQKERLARRAAEQEAAILEAQKEAANQPDQRAVEGAVMRKEFEARGLVEKSIRPDGHCLFSAVADQLTLAGIPLGDEPDAELKEEQRYKAVRKAAAGYIEGHPDDFLAWLDEPLESYVQKIRDTAEWGGHLELLAISKTYNIEICVLQNGSSQTIKPGLDEASKSEKIWLAYYRHGFALGEHYNSLRRTT